MIRRKSPLCFFAILFAVSVITSAPTSVQAQEGKAKRDSEAPTPRSKDRKKLFGTMEALRLARVSSPRMSPDGSRVAYLVAENKMEKDKPWKSVTQYATRSEEHTSELQSRGHLVCRLLLEKKKYIMN